MSSERKRTKVDTPRLVLGSSDKGEMKALTFFNDSQQKFPALELNKKQETTFTGLISLFDNKKIKEGSIEMLIADSLRLYNQAMGSILPHNCFLSFWQMAERMCCSDSFKGNTQEVIKRLKFHRKLFNLIASGYFSVLEELKDKRHDIVHRGIQNQISDEDINILKIICEIVLKWIIDNKKEIKTEHHLDEYYRLKNAMDQELETKAEVNYF